MGRIQFVCKERFGERELSYFTAFGRHWSCDVVLPHEDVPLRWLELRWIAGKWGWRPISSVGDTIGPSSWLAAGWRELQTEKGKRVVKLRGIASVELVDPSPPQPFALDLHTGRLLRRDELRTTLASIGVQRWRTADGTPLRDGAILVLDGRPLRLHLPQQIDAVAQERLSIEHADTILKLSTNLDGAVELGNTRVDLTREIVRLLLPYAEARVDPDHHREGWLTRDEAYERWLDLGGNPASESKRLGWLRGKAKTFLTRNGLGDVDALFASQRVGALYVTRIGLMPEQIVVL
jgi:hypothetical protein